MSAHPIRVGVGQAPEAPATPRADKAGITAAAVAATVGLARRLGLGPSVEPVVLREGANLTVRLSPHPVVARIATQTAAVREVEAYQNRELAVLDQLAATDAPAMHAARSVPPGPHEVDGWRLIFLHYYDHDPDRPLSGRQVGDSLAALHRAMGGGRRRAAQRHGGARRAAAAARPGRDDDR